MKYFPVFINLNSQPVLVVGGGQVAMRKVELLLKSGADINIVSQEVCDDLQYLINKKRVKWLNTKFDATILQSFLLCIVATNDNRLNAKIFKIASRQLRLVNVVDDIKHCSFIFPSIVNRSPVTIAITSSGKAPVLARLLREKFEALLPRYLGLIADIAGKYRKKVKKCLTTIYQRKYFWEKIFNGVFSSQVATGHIKKAKKTLVCQLKKTDKNIGEIILVGAGPGSSDLLTLRALQAIQSADVVFYDALVSNEILELIRRDAEKINVGKRAGLHKFSQDKINNWLVNVAKKGKRVIRLKGGDPFIFGRGGEEIQAAQKSGIPFQVIPGITAAIGAAAYASIPLTHRNYAQSITFITGHTSKNFNFNWSLLSQENQTIVFYMGLLNCLEISAKLIYHGVKKDTPIAIIGKATYSDQIVLTGTLNNINTLAKNIPSPAILIIGKVVKLHKKLKWFQTSSSPNEEKKNSIIRLD